MAREKGVYNLISGVRDPSLIVIAAEGEKTEVQYFKGVQEKIPREKRSRIKIKILDREYPTKSSPVEVLRQLDEYKKQYKIGKWDDLCMIIDRDSQSWEESSIASIAACCTQKQYVLALSNPCFDFWLLLHHKHISDYNGEELDLLFANKKEYVKKELRKTLGSYNPSNVNIDDFWPNISDAIRKAKELDINEQHRWPNRLGS